MTAGELPGRTPAPGPAVGREAVHVVEIHEPGRPVRRVAVDAPTAVGRNCDGLLLDDPAVSRRHLRLTPVPEGLVVVDDGSVNGTLVNGEPVAAPTLARAGDVIELGDTTLLVAR
jgi:pSer/pThr/pTyr-binding forkhead associated (FHA) protein